MKELDTGSVLITALPFTFFVTFPGYPLLTSVALTDNFHICSELLCAISGTSTGEIR